MCCSHYSASMPISEHIGDRSDCYLASRGNGQCLWGSAVARGHPDNGYLGLPLPRPVIVSSPISNLRQETGVGETTSMSGLFHKQPVYFLANKKAKSLPDSPCAPFTCSNVIAQYYSDYKRKPEHFWDQTLVPLRSHADIRL